MSKANKRSKTRDEAWENVFEEFSIVDKVQDEGSYFDITADEMKYYGQCEPRIMAKIDFREHLPSVMKSNGLACLAIKNGVYRIGRFDPFIDIDERVNERSAYKPVPHGYLTLDEKELKSESQVLDAAKISGVLADRFGETVELTIRGRSYSPSFIFHLNKIEFPVSSVQVEVDGGYEGATSVNLVEAKIGARGSLSVRQLLYPQQMWETKLGGRKVVRTFAMFYEAPLVRIIPILFEGDRCVADQDNERCYKIERNAEFDLFSVHEDRSGRLPLKDKPFPQADRFTTVIALFTTLSDAEEYIMSRSDLFDDFSIVSRQESYYANVLVWLGLAEITGPMISLTDFGKETACMDHAEIIERLAKIIFAEAVFHFVLRNPDVTEDNRQLHILFSRYWCVSASTVKRRLQTVKAWIKYFKAQTQGDL